MGDAGMAIRGLAADVMRERDALQKEAARLRRALESASIAFETIATDEADEGRRNSPAAQTARGARREASAALAVLDKGTPHE